MQLHDVKADSLMNRKKQINVLINLMLIQFYFIFLLNLIFWMVLYIIVHC